MASQYEVEHNIKAAKPSTRRRQIDMSTFTSHLNSTITPEHNNPNSIPNPVDLSAAFRLVQDQFLTLASSAPTDSNRDLLLTLAQSLEEDMLHPPTSLEGTSQEFVDSLDRVSRKSLKEDDKCPICMENFLDDQYCLVVELPCGGKHKLDLECVSPWLRTKGTCPCCRADLGERKKAKEAEERRKDKDKAKAVEEEEEDDDMDGLYA
ncbi:hypothetical protein QBC40DRAFT_278748 [Triangularia verruculosa]|uniref:RING-type domain-containing protein n=1 Tax=Triangularia verruculosa TaxID=2587418 RepID=A0AAN6XNL8_9PEZI|nr:hypothetical protein QBC40DRAFT_278748 [Triangularia verruculosa]